METLGLMNLDHIFWKNRRVLITGHTGFKGSWLTLCLLELGAVVYGYSLDSGFCADHGESLFTSLELEQKLGPTHLIGDLRDRKSLRNAVELAKPDVVFHLAAQSLVQQSYLDPSSTWSTNVQGSLELLEAFVQ